MGGGDGRSYPLTVGPAQLASIETPRLGSHKKPFHIAAVTNSPTFEATA